MQTEPIVTRYEANATQLLAELEKIRAGQAQVSDVVGKQVAALSTQNAALQKSVKFWGGLNVAITAIPGIVNKVTDTFDEMAGVLQQREAAAGVAVGQLDTALRGQLRTTELYTLAANLNHGALKLTQTQMNQVAGAIRKLSLDGENATEVADAFGKALDMNDAGPLKKFGLGLKDVDGKARSLADVLRTDVVEAANASAMAMETGSERMRAASNNIKNGIDDAKAALAGFASEVMGVLGGKTDGGVDGLASGLVALSGQFGFAGFSASVRDAADDTAYWGARIAAEAASAKAVVEELRAMAAEDEAAVASQAAGATSEAYRKLAAAMPGNRAAAAAAGKPNKSGGRRGSGQKFDLVAYNRFLDALALKQAEVAAEAARLAPRGFDGVDGLGGFDAAGTLARERDRNATLAQSVADDAAAQRDARESYLTGIFGPVEEFDAYASAFGVLEEAVSSAYAAIVTGDGGLGAVKKAIAGQLLAEGTRMSILALREGAWALAELAAGNIPSATAHGIAAAQFGAGAVAAGVGARLLGGGGSTGGGGAAAHPVGGNPAEAGGGRNNTTIVYGDSFANDSPRARQRTAAQLVDLARRETSSSARFN